MAPKPVPANGPDLIELGEGSAVRVESDGGLTFYLDKRDTSKTDFPEWSLSHSMPPAEVGALRRALPGGRRIEFPVNSEYRWVNEASDTGFESKGTGNDWCGSAWCGPSQCRLHWMMANAKVA